MNQEIRIYYESYEQANHYVRPIISKTFPHLHIKLVYLSKSVGYIEGSRVSKILKFKNPDILISFVKDEEEIPLFVIEFSEAVITEDHELQRFDGYIGAVAGECFYIKISPLKLSNSKHGGNTNFNIIEPYALIYKKFGVPSFHLEWPLESSNYVKRDKEYFSCPPNIKEFSSLLTKTIKYTEDNFEKIKKESLARNVLPILKKDLNLKYWIEKISKIELEDNSEKFNSSRLKWINEEKSLYFKFNRMGHGMDPERGMIWYYKYRYNKKIISKIIFPSTGDKVFKLNKLKSNYDFLKAFIKGTNLDKIGNFNQYLEDNKYLKSSKLISNYIDITGFVLENFNTLNKQLFAIFCNSEKFIIQDKKGNDRIILSWKINFDFLNKKGNLSATKIAERNFIEEDDVTYIVSHQVLKKNGFKIISISYPGAQGDRAILPQAGTGRSQQRKYIDVVAFYPNKYLDLTESKGAYNQRKVSADIDKLQAYSLDNDFKNALSKLVEKTSPENNNLPILLSVSFWIPGEKSNLKGLPIEKINFFVTISPDMKKWKVWIGGDLDIFQYKEGNVKLEKTYYVKK